MLVLTGKKHDVFHCTAPDGTAIEVAILEIRGNTIRLGFVASREVVIDRDVVHEKRNAEKAKA